MCNRLGHVANHSKDKEICWHCGVLTVAKIMILQIKYAQIAKEIIQVQYVRLSKKKIKDFIHKNFA